MAIMNADPSRGWTGKELAQCLNAPARNMLTQLAEWQAEADPEDDWPESLACAIPELVAARLIHRLQSLGIACDERE